MQHAQLEASQLSCIRQQRTLFAALSFQLQSGELLIIEGENGTGKSSLLRLLAGLATPVAGQIFWQNQPIHSILNDYWQLTHYLSHHNGIKLGLTVNENLVLTQHLNLTNPASIDTTLALLQLSAYKHQLTKHLSAGQKRRVALAKLFLFPKPIWILDEPLTALDINTQQLFLSQLDGHLKQGGMAIISSHHTLTVQAPTKKLRLIA